MRHVALLLFVVAVALLSFAAGALSDDAFSVRARTLLTAAEQAATGALAVRRHRPTHHTHRFVDVQPSAVADHRIDLSARTLAAPVLMAGGRGRFVDHCPGFVGCLAVEFSRGGRFVHATPFRPEAFEKVAVAPDTAVPVEYERALGFDFAEHADVFSIDRYPNGDLAVVLISSFSFPAHMGIARVRRDGQPLWYRADGSHHWPAVARGLLRGGDERWEDAVVVPSLRIGHGWPYAEDGSLRIPPLEPFGRAPCSTHFEDYLHVIAADGSLLWEVSVTDAFKNSVQAPMLNHAYNPCDPLHLNSVEVLGAAAPPGTMPGDLLVSLGFISALAVLDGQDGRVKQVYEGSFYGQHGARAFHGPDGPTLLVFDNWGTDGRYGPSRLLAYTARTGREWTVFPNAKTPSAVAELWSKIRGGVSVAPDGSRAVVAVHGAGKAVEVDLASGEVTAVFHSLHDVSHLVGPSDPGRGKAYRTNMRDVIYVRDA